MKKVLIGCIVSLFLFAPVTSFSMDHSKMDKKMDHSKMSGKKMDHDMGGMMEGSIMLGEEEVDGVKVIAHLNDVKEAMAAAGMAHTHHLMLMFTYMETGATIENGMVAVKVTDPDENEADATKMMGMDGHFGVDLVLNKPGMWHFKIGTKLPDGKKRTFHHHYEVK